MLVSPKPDPPPPPNHTHSQQQAFSRHQRLRMGPEKRKPGGGSSSPGSVSSMGTPLSNMRTDTQGSETLLQQGAPRPPEGRLHALHTKTHTTARATGQPAHPGDGGHASIQATHGENPPPPRGPACAPRASPPTSPQQRGKGNEATEGAPPPPQVRPGKRPRLAPSATASPRGH